MNKVIAILIFVCYALQYAFGSRTRSIKQTQSNYRKSPKLSRKIRRMNNEDTMYFI